MLKIAIVSGKGGAGKTSLSVMLSQYLWEKGEENLLVDLDVEEPNASLFFHGQKEAQKVKYKEIPSWQSDLCTFCGKCTKLCNFNALAMLPEQVLVFEELCHGCRACSDLCPTNALPMKEKEMGVMNIYKNQEMQLLEGLLNIGEQQAVPLIKQVKQESEQYGDQKGFTFFDAPPGTSCPMIEAVKDADYILLVSEATAFGLNDMKLTVDTLREIDKPFGVVVNKSTSEQNLITEYCRADDVPVVANVPYSQVFARAYARGRLGEGMDEQLTDAMKAIYEHLMEKLTV